MLKLQAYLTGFGSRSDGSASVRFATQELTTAEFSQLKDHLNGFGWMVFDENGISTEDIPKEIVEDKDKSPSKRLRAVLFILHKQKGVERDFETWYRGYMEKLIENVKEKLEN